VVDLLLAGMAPSVLEAGILRKVGKRDGGPMIEPSWIEISLLATSGAIGSLLVWGYQTLLKRR
jgi:hypothetical protein